MKNYNIFISMPFGKNVEDLNNEWTKLYKGGIEPIQSEYSQDFQLKIYRADHTLKNLSLKENVIDCIEDADVMVCVITENSNVLWELGYADALEKPIVFMVDNQILAEKRLPILAGQPNFCEYNHELVKQTSSSIDKCIDTLKPLRKDLMPYIEKAVDYSKHRNVGKSKYKINTYNNRTNAKLDYLISSAKKRVDILVTNLDWFVHQGSFLLEDISNHPFSRAIDNGAKLRILAMNPETVISEYRANQLGMSADIPSYRRVLRQSIKEVYNTFKTNENFDLRIYDELPLQITFRIDDIIITGIIAGGEKSRDLIHIELHKSFEGVAESFISHFQSVFNGSIDISRFDWVRSEVQ